MVLGWVVRIELLNGVLDHRSRFKTQLLIDFSHATLSPENVALGI
jgi:hypothetical protein